MMTKEGHTKIVCVMISREELDVVGFGHFSDKVKILNSKTLLLA